MKKLNEGPVSASNSVTRNNAGQKTTSRGYEDDVHTGDQTRHVNTKTKQTASVKGIGRKKDGEYSVTSTSDGKRTQRSKFSNRDDYDSALGIEKDIADLKTMEDFVEALDAIVAPILNDSDDEYDDEGDLDTTGMDLGNVGSELDQDDDDGKGFLTMPMYDQLGKILDSQDNPNPVNTVKTDDGKVIEVSPQQAKALRMLMTTDKVKPQVRTQFQRDLQTSNGLLDFVDIKDYHEIAQLFVKRYLG